MHLVYIVTVRHDYIGESKLAAEPLMIEALAGHIVKLENASIAINQFNPQTGQTGVNQLPLIRGKFWAENISINPKYIIDCRTIPKNSPLRKSYKKSWEEARAQNSGISLVKHMPTDLPPTMSLN